MMLDADVQPSMQLLREVVRSYQSHGALNFDVYKNSQSLYWPPFVYPWGRGPLEDKSIAETWFHVPAGNVPGLYYAHCNKMR